VFQAFNGLGMSVVFKHGSNLVRLFVISCAMIISTTLSILVLGVSLNILYFVTSALVITAIYIYYR
jgi:probable UDP-sugar transporter A4